MEFRAVHIGPIDHVAIVGNNGLPSSSYPLSKCQADCDSDADCAQGLICFFRSSGAPVPGCFGGEYDYTGSDYCIEDPGAAGSDRTVNAPHSVIQTTTPSPTHKPTPQPQFQISDAVGILNIVGNNGKPASRFPLNLCEGNCDSDSDCAEGLICLKRVDGDPVPGCFGGLNYGVDFCILDPYAFPNTLLAPVPVPQPTQPPTPFPTMSPTKEPTPFPTKYPSPYPTQYPTSYPTHPPVSGPTYEATGSPTLATTTTLVPTPAPTPPQPYHNVRIRLYWEEGYTWRGSTNESSYCMMTDYNGECWEGPVTGSCIQDVMYIATCNDDIRQRFSILFVNHTKALNDIVMIKVARDDRCFQRDGEQIVLQQCDATNDLQQWFTHRGAYFQRRFEISSVSLDNYCATQEQYPKPGEMVSLLPCSIPRDPLHETNFWERW